MTGERKWFSSAILPPWARKTPKITEVLPLLFLHGLSTGDFVPALGQFLGSSAGLSAAVITRLTEQWQAEQRAFAARGPVWCRLRVPVGGRDPREHPAGGAQAVPAGHDRRPRRWPQGAHRPGRRVPGVRGVVGGPAARLRPPRHAGPGAGRRDGALGFWGALREVFPQTREQRCWFHKSANVLAALPKSAHPAAKKALAGIWGAEDRRHALDAATAFKGRLRGEVPEGRREDHRLTLTSCSRSTTTPPSTGSTCGPPTRSSPPSPPSGTGPRSPRDLARGRRAWPWRSSSSSPRRTAGAPSTRPTSSPWSAPERPSPSENSQRPGKISQIVS